MFPRAGELGEGTRLFVLGASGALGSGTVQPARDLGAHVITVCGSAAVELVRALGTDVIIDRTAED